MGVALLIMIQVVVLAALVYPIATHRWARKSKTMVLAARIVACVLVQFIAILAATTVLYGPGEEVDFSNIEEVVRQNAASMLTAFAIVLVDVVVVIIIALFKSEWVEPLMR